MSSSNESTSSEPCSVFLRLRRGVSGLRPPSGGCPLHFCRAWIYRLFVSMAGEAGRKCTYLEILRVPMTIRALAAGKAFPVRGPYESLLRSIWEDDDTALLVHRPLVKLDGLHALATPTTAVDATRTGKATCEQCRSADRRKDVISRGILASAGACGPRLSFGAGESVNLRLCLDLLVGGGWRRGHWGGL